MDSELLRRQRESGSHTVSAHVERGRLPGSPRCDDDRGRVDGVADGLATDQYGRPRLWPEMEHGLDARHPRIYQAGPGISQVPPWSTDVFSHLCVQREFHTAALA